MKSYLTLPPSPANLLSSLKSDPPWLTVVMPSYCGEQWIKTSLESLVAEADPGVQVFVIDSSPSPTTRTIAESYSGRLRIRVIERCDLLSWHAKTNFGVKIAESTHICWLGVDDVWLPGRVAAMRDWITAAPSASLHLAPCAIIDKLGRRLGTWNCPLPVNSEVEPTMATERLLVQNFVAAPAPVFRREAWLACGGLDETLWYTADWDIWLKLSSVGAVYYHDAVTVGFRIHSNSLTVTGSRNPADFSQQMQTVVDRYLRTLRRDPLHVAQVAQASIAVNVALASAANGDFSGIFNAAMTVLGLGPAGLKRYFRDSRIVERLLPRVRAKISGAF